MRALILSAAVLAFAPAVAQAAPELSATTDLQNRREVTAGTRAYSVGFEDGRFYATGWHITGEMSGIWTPPMKMLDGLWFGVDGQWVGPATKFTSGQGYTRYDLPDAGGLHLQRTDFVPDDHRAALFGLQLTNPGAARTVTVKVDARSELMNAYPWSGTKPSTKDTNGPDSGSFDGNALVFADQNKTALVASTIRPTAGTTGAGFWGAQTGTICPNDSQNMPSQCDNSTFGNGTGGELTYAVTVPANQSRTLWIAVAGSDQSAKEARTELKQVLTNPDRELAFKIGARQALGRHSAVNLPGDPALQQAVDWGKQNLADLTQTAKNLQIRYTNQGTQDPPSMGSVPSVTFYGAGYPDYPWLFATDGEYTSFAAVAYGQFETIEAHLRALRDVSEILNDHSGKVAHETVQDGHVYYGANSDPGNTDETVKFASAVATVWRWTGDDAFRDDLYDFAKRGMHYVTDNLDADHDGWPEGPGNVERTGMGPEKLDNAVYYIRGLYDLADMARAKHDMATANWATGIADADRAKFDSTWWDASAGQYADSLSDANQQLFQEYWIGVTPMEAELPDGSSLAPADHAQTAMTTRESSCYTGTPPFNPGMFHTGCTGPPAGSGEKVIYSLTSSVAAVAEGNYGKPDNTFVDANTVQDEMPGALPETLPAPDQGANIDRCWTCRSMVMQAWGQYGIAWPVIHLQLGVDPSLGDGRLAIVPQVPAGQPSVEGNDIRLGDGSADVLAAHSGNSYTTTTQVDRVKVKTFTIGTTLPNGSTVASATLDGRRVNATATQTTRGLEVTTTAKPNGRHVFSVTTR
jgi:hypothetical protein